MTTSHSPLSAIKAQADGIAKLLKAAERGEPVPALQYAQRIEAARQRPEVKFAIAMDDKIITIEMRWDTIRETSEAAISANIVKYMRGQREH